MIHLDAATVLVQWSVGILVFLWVTTRRREVSLGYGWMMRGVAIIFAGLAVVVAQIVGRVWVRDIATVGVAVAATVALVVSVQRRRAGVRGQRERIEQRQANTFARTGIERNYKGPDRDAPEFPPVLDLVAPVIGIIALISAGVAGGGDVSLAIARTVVGALFLGAITDAMLLAHWYLVQPGLSRGPILQVVRLSLYVWPAEVAVLLIPTGMVSVLNGTISDRYGGTLGWMWLGCAIGTGILLWVATLALRERYYSAVMAATGLLYLAILTGFGTDLLARALLGGI